MFYNIRRNLGFTNRTTCAIQVTHIKEEKSKRAIENATISVMIYIWDLHFKMCFYFLQKSKAENMGWTIKINFGPWIYFFQCLPNNYLFWTRKYTRWHFSLVFISNFRNRHLSARWKKCKIMSAATEINDKIDSQQFLSVWISVLTTNIHSQCSAKKVKNIKMDSPF